MTHGLHFKPANRIYTVGVYFINISFREFLKEQLNLLKEILISFIISMQEENFKQLNEEILL